MLAALFLTAGHHLLEAAQAVPPLPGRDEGAKMHHPIESNLGPEKNPKQCSELVLKPAAASVRHRLLGGMLEVGVMLC